MKSAFLKWVEHRIHVVGFENWKQVEKQTDLPRRAINAMKRHQSLDDLQRSEIRFLGEALRVPVGMLQKMDRGELQWIPDDYQFDPFRPGPALARKESNPDFCEAKSISTEERGTPILGEINDQGLVAWEEMTEFTQHILVRYGNGREVFALRQSTTEKFLIFQNVPLHEFSGGLAVVYVSDGMDETARYGRVSTEPGSVFLTALNGTRTKLDAESVQRLGKFLVAYGGTK